MFYFIRILILIAKDIYIMFLRKLRLLIEFTRWKDWILWIVFILFGYFLAPPALSPLSNFAVLILVFLLVESFGFAINDYFDAEYDKMKQKTHNVISRKLLDKETASVFCAFLLLSGITTGFIFLPFFSFLSIAVLYAIFFFYSSPPFRLKERAFIDIISHGMFNPLLMIAAYLLKAPFGAEILLISFSAFLFSVLICLTQEIRDMVPDKKAGFRTTAIKLGYRNSLNTIRIIFLVSIVPIFLAIIIYRPIYWVILLSGLFFYLKMLFSNPLQKEFFENTVMAMNRGLLILAIAFMAVIIMDSTWVAI